MYRVILAAVIASGVFMTSTAVYARPSHKHHHYHRHVKHKKLKQETFVKVETVSNPIFNGNDDSVASFFIQEANKTPPRTSVNVAVETRDQKRQRIIKSCSWFTCAGGAYQQAKSWEGKTARGNRQELKALFNEGGVPPIDPNRTQWCAAFANAILRREGYEGTNSLMARSFLTWGHKTNDPKEGDIVVLRRGRNGITGHVGFFAGYEWYGKTKYVKVFGGNTGHAVQTGYFPVNKVLGYRSV